MGNRYDKSLNRLRQKRMDNPEYTAFRRVMAGMAEPVKAINRQTSGNIQKAGGSIGTIAQSGFKSQEMIQDMATERYNVADTEVQRRRSILDDQIEQTTQLRDAEDDKQKDAGLKTGIKLGGTIVGAGVGALAGDPVSGAQIGSAAGDIGASFVGGGGKFGAQYVDEQQLAQGIADTATGILSTITLSEQKKMVKETAGFFGENMGNMTSEELIQARMVAASGDLSAWREFTSKYKMNKMTAEVDADVTKNGIPTDEFSFSSDPTNSNPAGYKETAASPVETIKTVETAEKPVVTDQNNDGVDPEFKKLLALYNENPTDPATLEGLRNWIKELKANKNTEKKPDPTTAEIVKTEEQDTTTLPVVKANTVSMANIPDMDSTEVKRTGTWVARVSDGTLLYKNMSVKDDKGNRIKVSLKDKDKVSVKNGVLYVNDKPVARLK
ncbi:MAG TPA: glycine zipper family protein [Candidatus Cloacimonadota bacterium]|nr:glycine zipper family protein [Candidatus Cloacimonadota bacterium]HPS39236.1 glycine zipper family protein [Candidatus Cloacimonadota bacterium]